MKLACVRALAELAHAEIPESVASAYGDTGMHFGPEYLIPKPFDPRLIKKVAPAVAQAAMNSGVATRPITDFDAYVEQLERFVYRTGTAMKPVFAKAKVAPRKLVYAEGEDERVLRAAQIVVDEGIARPILIGREDLILQRIREFGLRLVPGENCECVNILGNDPAYVDTWREYFELAKRRGVSPALARREMRTRTTLFGAILVRRGEADAMLCGTNGPYDEHLKYVRDAIGMRAGVRTLAAMQMLMMPDRQLFICDTHVNLDPTAEQIAEITLLAAEAVRLFGLTPSVALLSHSSFGTSDAPSAVKMREALGLIRDRNPDLAIDGEMHGDAALSKPILDARLPDSTLTKEANLLIMPNVDSAHIACSLLRMVAGGGITVGGILLGAAKPVHIMTSSSTVRRIVNMSAFAVVDNAPVNG